MHVTRQEGHADSSAQGKFLKSLDERIALLLEKRSYELKIAVQSKEKHNVVFGRPVVIL